MSLPRCEHFFSDVTEQCKSRSITSPTTTTTGATETPSGSPSSTTTTTTDITTPVTSQVNNLSLSVLVLKKKVDVFLSPCRLLVFVGIFFVIFCRQKLKGCNRQLATGLWYFCYLILQNHFLLWESQLRYNKHWYNMNRGKG